MGLFNYFTSLDSPENSAQYIKNLDFNRRTGLTKRHGGTLWATATQVDGGNRNQDHLFIYLSTSSNFQGSNFFIYKMGSDVGVYGIGGGAAAGPNDYGVLGSQWNNQVDGINYAGSFYLISLDNPTYKLQRNAGASPDSSIISTIPQGSCAATHLDRLIVSCTTTTPLRYYYSESLNPENVNSNNFQDLTPTVNGDAVTGLGVTLLGSQPIYTKTTTRAIIGTVFPSLGTGGNTSVRMISESIGCLHHRTIKNMNNKQYFLSKGIEGQTPGIYSFNGITVSERTKAIRNFFLDNVDMSTRAIPNAFIDGQQYCVNVASKGSLGIYYTICIDDNEVPSIWQGAGIAQLVRYGDTRYMMPDTVALGLSGTSRQIFKMFVPGANDVDNSTVTWEYKTKDFDIGDRYKPKHPVRAYISYGYTASSFTVRANYDQGVSSAVFVINATTTYRTNSIVTLTTSSSTMISKLVFPDIGDFHTINFDFSGSSACIINEFSFYSYPKQFE